MNNAVSARRSALRSEMTKPADAGWAPAVPVGDVVTIESSQAVLDDGRKPHYRHPVRADQWGRTARRDAIRMPYLRPCRDGQDSAIGVNAPTMSVLRFYLRSNTCRL